METLRNGSASDGDALLRTKSRGHSNVWFVDSTVAKEPDDSNAPNVILTARFELTVCYRR